MHREREKRLKSDIFFLFYVPASVPPSVVVIRVLLWRAVDDDDNVIYSWRAAPISCNKSGELSRVTLQKKKKSIWHFQREERERGERREEEMAQHSLRLK